MTIELRPVSDALRASVLALAPLPEQERYAGRPAETLPEADADPLRYPVAILSDDTAVGFFVLHRSESPLAPAADDALLRAFFVDAAAQGRGVATGALARLPEYVREHMPDVRRVVLSVNVGNPVAIRTYRRAGFSDQGKLYHGGAEGPQHVLELEVQPEPLVAD